jgi:hypothetical protein
MDEEDPSMTSFNKKFAILGLAALGLAHGALPATAGGSGARLAPAQGHSLDIGSKRAIAYFVPENGACSVTVMLGDDATDKDPVMQVPTRVNMIIGSGTSSRIDAADGPSLDMACSKGAQSLSLQKVERTAYTAVQHLN